MTVGILFIVCSFFFSSRRRHTRYIGDWSSDVCSSDLLGTLLCGARAIHGRQVRGGRCKCPEGARLPASAICKRAHDCWPRIGALVAPRGRGSRIPAVPGRGAQRTKRRTRTRRSGAADKRAANGVTTSVTQAKRKEGLGQGPTPLVEEPHRLEHNTEPQVQESRQPVLPADHAKTIRSREVHACSC